MTGDSIGTLIDTLWQGRLVDPEVLREVAGPAQEQATSAHGLVADLVNRGVLTPFQAAECEAGRANRLALGPYRMQDLLGEGKLGRVFRALHEPTGRMVALKVLHEGALAGPEEVHRFHREAEAAARLAHPNLAAVLDDGTCEGTHYLAMEAVEGAPLPRFVAENGPLAPAHACRLARQAALALQHAFEHRLVPCNLTPSAVIVTDEGSRVKLLIAGQGWLGPSARGLGEFDLGSLLEPGTEAWDEVALEMESQALRADAQAGLRGLGRVLRGMLAGRWDESHHEGLESPGERPDRPPGLAAVLVKMEASNPAEGYASPAECAEALTPFCDVVEVLEPVLPIERPGLTVVPAAVPQPVPTEPSEKPAATAAAAPPAHRSLVTAAFVFLMGMSAGAGTTWVIWDHQARSIAHDQSPAQAPPVVSARDLDRPPISPAPPSRSPEPTPAPVIAPTPEDFIGLIESSERSLKHNRIDEAIARLDEAIRLKPDLAATYTRRAAAHASMQANEEVIADCNKAVAIDPNDALAYRLRAVALSALGDDEGAVADATQAIERDAHDAQAYNARGAAQFRLGKFRAALDDLNEAVFLDEASASARGNLSRVLASATDPAFRNGALAVKHATRACQLTDWKDPVHLDDLAAAYAECRQYDRAIQLEAEALGHAGGLPRSLVDCYQSRMAYYVARRSDPPPSAPLPDPVGRMPGNAATPPPPVPAFRRVPERTPPPAPLPTYRSGSLSRGNARRVGGSRTIEIPRP